MKSAGDSEVADKSIGHINLKKHPEVKEGEAGVVPGPDHGAGWTLGLNLLDPPCIPDKERSEIICDKNQGQREKTRGQSGSDRSPHVSSSLAACPGGKAGHVHSQL